jgi:hyperosmotically inducible periplasmic protein
MKASLSSRALAAALAAGAALLIGGCAVTSGQSSVGQYVDDATISTRVKARMAEDANVNALRIQVETLNGTVQLAGFATNQSEKDRAGQLARDVPGVQQVRNNIIVRAPSTNPN